MDLKNIKILSGQKWNNYFPLQVVYEWERILAKELNIEVDYSSMMEINRITSKKGNIQAQRVIRNSFLSNYIDSSFNYVKRKFPGTYFLTFFLYPLPIKNHYVYNDTVIPVLLDCFKDVIDKVPQYFKRSKLLFVTNLEVYEYLRSSSIGNRIVYVPLSISDQYYTTSVPSKKIDVLQMGRQNPKLHQWMLQLIEKHPSVEYVYSVLKDSVHTYFSTTKGWIGTAETRSDFMALLSSAKISLLSSPGIDGGEERTGGYNPVTPRFFESAINYCYMAGRYPVNSADFKYCNIANVCKNYDYYKDFERDILKMIEKPFDQVEDYTKFNKQHFTSQRAKIIREAIQNL